VTKNILLALIGLGLLGAPASAQTYRDSGGTIIAAMRPTELRFPLGYCQLSVTTAVQMSACPGGIPAGATWAMICNEGSAARWRDDGVAVTANVGMPLAAGLASAPVCFNYFATFSTLQWIAQSGSSLLDISFYK